jgi:hypothetical protein
MLTHLHMVVYTWCCWHICKGEVVGVEIDQLGEEKVKCWVTGPWLRLDRTLSLAGPVANPR